MSLKQVVGEVKKLVSFPTVANELFSIIDSDTSDAQAISNVIQLDPALSASLLKLANSAWYMAREPVSSIEGAIIRIGTRDVGKIAMNICVQNSFKDIPEHLFSLDDYLNHSLRCAFASQEVARRANLSNLGTMYTAGLLHDIGQLIILNLYPEKSGQVLAMNIEDYDGTNLQACEYKIFGFDHTQVGNELAKTWNFPNILQQCIHHHHLPNNATESIAEVCSIHIANSIATLNEFDSDNLNDASTVHEFALSETKLTQSDIIDIADISSHLYKNNRDRMFI